MYAKVRQPLSAAKIPCLVRAWVYRERHLNLWGTREAFRHFLRSRREELERRGLLFELTSGFHVDAEALDAALPELLRVVPLQGK